VVRWEGEKVASNGQVGLLTAATYHSQSVRQSDTLLTTQLQTNRLPAALQLVMHEQLKRFESIYSELET